MDPKLKNAIERLFNILGKKIAKDYYNLDLNFEVVGELKNSPNYLPDLMIEIQTDKKLPQVLKNYAQDTWDQERYDPLESLQTRLGKLLKYLGLKENEVGLILNPNQPRHYNLPEPNENDYIDFPERFLPLMGENSDYGASFVVVKDSGYVHYLMDDKTIDIDNSYHLSDIDDEWFWNNLTPQDKRNIEELYG